METLRAAVDKATTANTGSINSLTNLREALANLRNELPSTDKEFKQLTNRLQAVDERANKLSTNVGRKLTGMQLAQGVGAALSGGIFGGPEGLIGGLGGLAIGGVGGSFAGAAFGAQVGMFRQQLGAVTEYSARIDKLQIALRGIVGSQDAYKQALAAAASVTRDLNIPQEVAIQGMTRLSAAVKGAGGNVSDSAFAFRAINEAVKATGGNAEQVDGALLALTQVFSKGKVSAEELNQIAERLPGTFTLFAKAAGMTGPQLQKALQEGQVGLNDLLKFLQLISSQYGQTALKIAASSQDAGARLSVAMKQMQLDVGRALQPIGASLQSAFADFITKITPAFIAAAQGLAAAFEFLIENKTASGLATFALQLGAVTAGLVALRSAMTAISALNIATTFTSAAASAKITGDVLASTATSAGSLSAKLVGLRGLIGNLALSFAKPLILTVAVVGAAVVIDYLNKINAAKDRLKRAGTASRGDTWLQEIGGSALDVAALRRQVQAAGDTYQYLADKIKQAREEQATTPFKPRKEYLQTQINADLADLAIAQSRYRAGIDALAQRTPAKPSLPRFPGLSVEDEKKKNLAEEKQARDAQTAAAEQQRLNNEIFDQQIKAQDRLFEHGIALDRQRYEMQKRLDDLQSQNRVMRETGVSREIVSNFEDLQRGLRDIEERRMETTAAIVRAKQAQQSAEARSSFAAAGAAALSGTAGIIARTGSTGQSTGPHLDARWADGRRISVADVDRYISVNGRTPSSYGITSPYGPRSMFGRSFHAGIDFGTPSGSGITLKDGATLLRDLGFTGAGGYAVEINTKQGPMRLLHLQRGSTKLPTGALAQQGRAIKTAGGAAIEALDVTQAERQQQLLESKVAEERAALFEQFILKASASLRDQNAALRDNAELQKLRNRLTLEGVSSSQIDLEEALLKVRQDQNKQEQTYKDLTATTRNPKVQATLNTALAEQNAGFAEQVRLLREAAAAKREFDDAMQFRQDSDIGKGLRDGAKSYVESIGTMREATSQLAQTGIKGVEDAIFSLVTTGTANFRDFAKQILENTARMIIQQLILRTVMQAIGAIGGGGGSALAKTFEMPGAGFPTSGFKFANGGAFASNGIVPFAMGGVVNRPTMFAFANGGVGRLGLMGEAGPEAIMPLRRLPSGRLGIESAGGGAPVTVNVSVDATGSQVQGDAGQASQLARVVAGAVQAELIKQKRPGGILSS
jgi:lambda family phage tail tape measure protein